MGLGGVNFDSVSKNAAHDESEGIEVLCHSEEDQLPILKKPSCQREWRPESWLWFQSAYPTDLKKEPDVYGVTECDEESLH